MRYDLLPPPDLLPDAVRKVRDEVATLTAERADAVGARAAPERSVAAAKDEDTVAAATAHRAGKPDPGMKRTDAARADLAAVERRHEILSRALSSAEADLDAVVEREAGGWRMKLTAGQEDERRNYLRAVDVLVEALRAMRLTSGTLAWLSDTSLKFNGQSGDAGYLPGLMTANGSPPSMAEVVEALRRAGQPPPSPIVEGTGISQSRMMPVPEAGYTTPTSAQSRAHSH